jgi:hypothetical protein
LASILSQWKGLVGGLLRQEIKRHWDVAFVALFEPGKVMYVNEKKYANLVTQNA